MKGNPMASISDDPNGRKRIQFVAGDGHRKTIRLGKATTKQAEAFKVKVEALIGAGITGSMDNEVSRWLATLNDKIHARLAAVGLVKSRSRTAATLGTFLDELFAGMVIKPNTLRNYTQARRLLEKRFGGNKALRDIAPMDADQFRTWLVGRRLSGATIAKYIINIRMMFKRAVKWKLIGENPFADVKAGSQANKARMFFITRDMAGKVLEACPDAQWRLLFALSRYGGLRCPSEHLAMTWGDVDWEHNRIRVPSPKTAHHEGGDCRFIPLFSELRPHLQEVFDEAEPGTEHVITRYRDTRQNLRTQLCRIIHRAGLTPWPKPWHNLRSTRQTELAERYPIHVVCAWLGNSRAVAQAHYLQVTDAHFAEAINSNGEEQEATKNEEAQNQAQYPAVRDGIGKYVVTAEMKNNPDLPDDSDPYDTLQNPKRSRQESNTPTNCPEKRGVADMGGAESGALSSDLATKQHGSIDLPGLSDVPDVAKIWGTLPANVQADILALLRSANKPKS